MALVEVDKQDTGGRDVKPVSGFAGRVLLDEGERVREAWGLTYGSVVLVDPEGRERWRKPGSAYKRPRAELVAASVRALVERARDPGAVEAALARLADASPRERAVAARRLAELEPPEARAALETRAADPAEAVGVRTACLAALARLRDPRSLDVAAAVAGDDGAPRDVRRAAAELLVGFGDDFDPPAGENWRPRWTSAESRELGERHARLAACARSLLDADTSDLRRPGAALLARLRHADALEPLLALAGDRDGVVREHALTGLCEWRDDARVRALAEALQRDRATDVKRVARYVLDGPVGKLRE